jgi:acyl CoA:acetate/3-ketoacid CoA transferase
MFIDIMISTTIQQVLFWGHLHKGWSHISVNKFNLQILNKEKNRRWITT